jgi:hypothetical protein
MHSDRPMEERRKCNTCVMDTSDPDIVFFNDGTCSHCRHARRFTNDSSHRYALQDIISHIASSISSRGRGSSSFDVLIGLSGGVDSTWLLHLLADSGLRIYVHHVDTCWNSPEATANILGICERLNLPINTHVVDWDIMRRLQVAFFYAGVINQDIPQDMAIFSSQVQACLQNQISFIASGANNTTESILPTAWGHHWHDQANLSSIFYRFYGFPLWNFPYCTFEDLVKYRLNMHDSFQTINVLDLIHYNKNEAVSVLVDKYGYSPYRHKHGESLWTLYYQAVYLPSVYNIDKRKAHLSNLIINGELSRDDALAQLSQPTLPGNELVEICNLISLKLSIPLEHALNPGSYVLRTKHKSYTNTSSVINHYTRLISTAAPELRANILSMYVREYGASGNLDLPIT